MGVYNARTSMDLFKPDPKTTPLADRMRPRSFDEVVGQDHLVADGAPFRSAVEAGRPGSAILWGPPGVGKTTLARLLADVSGHRIVAFSAVMSGIKEIRAIMQEAARTRRVGTRTLVFVDEIHRFNKSQQDAFLPYVESGDIVLLGATTENPSFEVNSALLSRMTVHTLRPLVTADVGTLLERAIADAERGVGEPTPELEPGLLDDLVATADGDARRALNALEALVETTRTAGGTRLERSTLARVIQKKLAHDKAGESHYDVISAFIKSVRNSDPDAAVYWLARLLEAGEDPLFVARRLVILASEDVGLADPRALPLANAAFQATHAVGMPEARLMLSEATIYLALAAKSNSAYRAYQAAAKDVNERALEPVPLHLRNAPTALMKKLDYGKDYRYVHDDPAARSEMSCLPDGLSDRRYYEPGPQGEEPLLNRDGNEEE